MAACYKVASLLLACDYLDYILFSSIHKLCPMVVVTCEEPNRTRSQREQYLCTPRDISKLQVPPSVQSYRFASLWWTHHSWPGHPENLQNEKLTHQIASRDFFFFYMLLFPLIYILFWDLMKPCLKIRYEHVFPRQINYTCLPISLQN